MNGFAFLAAPARRALARAGYRTLADLDGASTAALARLHGMGPKALEVLKARLAEHGISLKP
jgi:hypothetical protein